MSTELPQVDIDATNVAMLAGQPHILAEFPLLAGLLKPQPASTGCGSCRRSMSPPRPNYNRVLQQIANMTPADKAKLKHLLGAAQVSLRYYNEAGQKIKRIF